HDASYSHASYRCKHAADWKEGTRAGRRSIIVPSLQYLAAHVGLNLVHTAPNASDRLYNFYLRGRALVSRNRHGFLLDRQRPVVRVDASGVAGPWCACQLRASLL
ncbi:MAG: hypothetical protein ACPIOQ_73835, partial [Promethearchaeia archaeon]